MKVQSLKINRDLQLTALDPEQVAESLKNPDVRIWLDLEALETVELEEWLDKLRVTDLSRQLCLEARDRPGIYPLNKELLLVVPVLINTDILVEVDYMAILCRENLLLTLHHKKVAYLEQTDMLQGADAWLPDRSIAGLVSAILIDLSLESLQRATDQRTSIIALQERMDREPETVEAEEILDMRSHILALGTVVSDQLPSVEALSTIDKPFFKRKDSQDYMNCALVNFQAANRSLNRMSEQIGALRIGFQLHAQDQTNRRLNILTILSAIFMPITLLAGIWGMNFQNMPELKYAFGYPMALGFMALVGSGMFLFFRKGGWFD